MPTLIIYLPTELPQASSQVDYVLSPDGRSEGAHSSAALALLPGGSGFEVVAVVPVQALSWHQVQLPRGLVGRNTGADRSTPRLRAALEGLLEEHLLDEAADVHFALDPDARDGAPTWVAACNRAWLRAWTQALEQQHRPASRIVPEFAPTANALSSAQRGQTALHMIGTEAAPLLVFAKSSDTPVLPGAAMGGAGLVVLPMTVAALTMAHWPADAPVVAEPAVAALAERHFARVVTLQSRSARWLAAAASGWDLAQFDLVSSGGRRRWRRLSAIVENFLRAPAWRASRWACVALVATHLAGLNAWAWAQRNSLEAKRQAVQQVLTSTFPGVKVVVDAPVQMSREVQRLRVATGAASSGDFELLLEALAQSVPVGMAPSTIDYSANELRLKGLSLLPNELAAASERARARQVNLRMEGGSLVLSPLTAP